MGLPVRRKVTGTTRWPFVFLGEALEAVARRLAVRPAPELGLQDCHGPIRLVWAQHGNSNGSGHHVRDLQALGVRPLVRHHQPEWQRPGEAVFPFTDAPELQFQLGILPFAARLDDEVRGAVCLAAF